MSTPEFDEFDLEGLSLEEVESSKPVKAEQLPAEEMLEQELKSAQPIEQIKPVEEVVQAAPPPAPEAKSDEANLPEGQMMCPKCELVQEKAEQCSGCSVYIAKAKAAIGQSKIQITSTKF